MKDNEHKFFKEAVKCTLPNSEKIKSDVLDKAQVQNKTRSLKWLMPVAACALAAVIICTSVPSVRAAIVQWFSVNNSVQEYIAHPEEERPSTPELDVIIEESKPDNIDYWGIEILNVSPEWQEWADTMEPCLGDVFFDGKELIVAADLGPDFIGFWDGTADSLSLGNPGYIIINGDKYAYDVNALGMMSTSKFTATINFARMIDQTAGYDGWTQDQKQSFLEYVSEAQQYDPQFTPFDFLVMEEGIEFDGVQQVEVNLPMIVTDYMNPNEVDNTGASYQGEVVALMKLKFSFDPKAGKSCTQVYEINKTFEFSGEGTFMFCDDISEPGYQIRYNKTLDMSGVELTVKRIKTTATGAELYIGLNFPDSWSYLDKKSFKRSLHLTTYGDGVKLRVSGTINNLAEGGEDFGMCDMLKVLPSEIEAIQAFEILPVLSYFTGYDDVPYVEGEPTKIKEEDDGVGWQSECVELNKLQFTLDN